MNSAAPLPRALHLAPLYSTAQPPSTHERARYEAVDQGKQAQVARDRHTPDEGGSLHFAPPKGRVAQRPETSLTVVVGARSSGGTGSGSGRNGVSPSGSSTRSTEKEDSSGPTVIRSTASGRRVAGEK